MPRVDKKASKIAFNILGTPGNMQKNKFNRTNER